MGVEVLLEIAASMCPDRPALSGRGANINFSRLWDMTGAGAATIADADPAHVVFLGLNGPAFTVALFSAARAGIPVTPLNYRLPQSQLSQLIGELSTPLVIADEPYMACIPDTAKRVETDEFMAAAAQSREPPTNPSDAEQPLAVLLTSGTTSQPKGVILRHSHLTAYVVQTVDAASAGERECALISVPPYHIAAVAAVLSNAYACRRVVHLPAFTPEAWLSLVKQEGVTSAMVVPTMLSRIVDALDNRVADTPTLRSLSYGGARLPSSVLSKAMRAFPDVGFTNAFGLTETA
jgi:acyl-CoA synthetase (AMP-forming)/AMP-acid ligase II